MIVLVLGKFFTNPFGRQLLERKMPKGSIFKGLTRREAEDLINAVKSNKYWKVNPGDRDFICVVALSRARIKSRRGMYAKATHLGRVEVSKEAAKFCRKWRILLVDTKRMLAISVLTWRAFNRIVSKGLGPAICSMLVWDKPPVYFNARMVSKLFDKGHKIS